MVTTGPWVVLVVVGESSPASMSRRISDSRDIMTE